MKTRLGLLAVATLVVVSPACGGGRAGDACAALFLSERATRSQVAGVRADLRGKPFVRSVRSVSKEKALGYYRRKYPELANSLTAGPLPDTLYVTPRSLADLAAVRAEIRRFGKLVDVVTVDAAPCPTGQ